MGRRSRGAWGGIGVGLCLLGGLSGCGGSSASNVRPLDRLNWCDGPSIHFIDESTTPSTTIVDWPHAQSGLGFDPLLPPTLPRGSCLQDAGGVLHDPVFGGRFTLTYQLPDSGALSIAEAQQQQPIPAVMCSSPLSGATGTIHITTCRQTRNGLDIALSSTQTAAQITVQFNTLAASITWFPLSTPPLTPTPSVTPPITAAPTQP